MNKLSVSIIGLLTTCNLFATQLPDKYRINGEAPMLNDGDTLFVTDDPIKGTPTDTLIIENGKFEKEGKTGSAEFRLVYSTHPRGIYSPFFIEPGTISIRLSAKPEETRVEGTPTNDAWQEMNDSVMEIKRRIDRHYENNNLSNEEQQQEFKELKALHAQYKALVTDYARKNTDNEFGYFLLMAYSDMAGSIGLHEPDGLIDIDTRLELISKLPHDRQERPAMKRTVEKLHRMKATAEGNIMPDFTMDDTNGKPVNALTEITKNKLTIIDFWASWCGPCRRDMPDMVRLYNTYKDKGLGILGVSLDSKREAWKSASKNLGIVWPQVSDLKGWNNAAAQLFNVRAIPQTIVVSSDGTILKKGLRGSELEDFVASQLK